MGSIQLKNMYKNLMVSYKVYGTVCHKYRSMHDTVLTILSLLFQVTDDYGQHLHN